MLDRDILRDRAWCSNDPDTETSRTMFIMVFSDVGDVCMMNSIIKKHKCYQIIQRRALSSGKGYVEYGL